MITSRPFACAPDANAEVTSGVRCADMTCFSFGTPNFSNTSTACCIVSQSDDEPMITATSGLLTISYSTQFKMQNSKGKHRTAEFGRTHAVLHFAFCIWHDTR